MVEATFFSELPPQLEQPPAGAYLAQFYHSADELGIGPA